MIKAVIFDFNGVFTTREFLSGGFERDFGVSKEAFMPALKEIMEVVRKPNAPNIYNLWKPYLEKWGIKMTEKEFLDYWFLKEHLVPELVDFAKELKQKGVRIYIFSNNFKERSTYYRQKWPEIFSIFDKVYFSWETGLVKSQPEAYLNLLKDAGLKGTECVYFDDSEKNIELAKTFGINSFIYEGLDKVNALKIF